jgi:hypothetical protein
MLKMLELNAAEPLAIWKLEKRGESTVPVLEGTIMLERNEHRSGEMIWQACGTLDALYKSSLSALSSFLFVDSNEMSKTVRDFLQATGFRKVRESSTPSSHFFLVVLSDDKEPNGIRCKCFAMRIEVTGIVTFRIYFSLDNAVAKAKGNFPVSAIEHLAELNLALPVGYFNYDSRSNQIQLILKLHYKMLSPGDLSASIKTHYEACVYHYLANVSSFVTLYEATEKQNWQISKAMDDLMLKQADKQGGHTWKLLDYRGNK